jgi:hypothetical protein
MIVDMITMNARMLTSNAVGKYMDVQALIEMLRAHNILLRNRLAVPLLVVFSAYIKTPFESATMPILYTKWVIIFHDLA